MTSPPDTPAPDPTFAEAWELWLAYRIHSTRPLRASTLADYASVYRRHLGPAFAETPLHLVDGAAIARFVIARSAMPSSPNPGSGAGPGAVRVPPNERSRSMYEASAGTPAGRGAGVAGVRDACAVVEPPLVGGDDPPEHAVVTADPEWEPHRERRSLSRLALGRDLAAHETGVVPADGEAEAGPAVVPRRGGRPLPEGREEPGDLVGRHAALAVRRLKKHTRLIKA